MDRLPSESGELLIFKAISTFIIELGRLYEKDHVPLGLYKRLILKTKISHTRPIKKHIAAFQLWLNENKEAINGQNHVLFKSKIIKYSDNVYIDMAKIFEIASADDVSNTIWKHIKTIHSLINGGQGSIIVADEKFEKENDFISEVMKKVETHIDPKSDPSQALSNMMNSGIFNDLLGSMNKGITDGSLDLSKLISITTGMLGSLQKSL